MIEHRKPHRQPSRTTLRPGLASSTDIPLLIAIGACGGSKTSILIMTRGGGTA